MSWDQVAGAYRSIPLGIGAIGAAIPPSPTEGVDAGSPRWLDRFLGVLGIRRGVPAAAVSLAAASGHDSPIAQLERLGAQYRIPRGHDTRAWQRAIVRALIIDECRRQGVPPKLALAVAYHESRMTMWRDPAKGTTVTNVNTRDGAYHSTDHGVMQINDRAHRDRFPLLAKDLEANVRFGVAKLARILRSDRAIDLGLGLGRWDGVLSVYGIGHLPRTESEWALRRRRTAHYQRILANIGDV